MYKKRTKNHKESVKHMATTTFDKKIILNGQAADNLANASSFDKGSIKGRTEPVVKSTDDLIKWLSHLKK